MMNAILNDLRLYQRLIAMQLRAQAQYKVNLAIDIGTYFIVTSLEFAGLLIFFGPFPSLLGWKVGEVALIYAIMSLSFGIAEMVGAGIDEFEWVIRRGEFDRVLLRPVGVLLQVISSDFRLRRLGRLTQGGIAFAIALSLLPKLHWTLAKLIVLPICILSGSVVFVSVLLLGAALCFWTVETTELTNILTYGGREMLSYPITIYNQVLQRFFLFVVPLTIYNQVLQRFFLFVVPLAFSSFVPACYLLGRPLPFGLPNELAFAAPGIALAFALVASAIWRFGVRHYQSTGS